MSTPSKQSKPDKTQTYEFLKFIWYHIWYIIYKEICLCNRKQRAPAWNYCTKTYHEDGH